MVYSLISLIIIANHCLIPILNASPPVDDKMLIAFMKGQQEIQISDYSKQKYEAHLGIIYFVRKNWHCDKIADEFEEYERTECQKYRKYLDILYEYLYREYVGIQTVKPQLVFKNLIEIEGPIIYVIFCLAKLWEFYFESIQSVFFGFKLDKFFIYYFEPKLLNVERLNYEIKFENEPKMPINELILQLAIDTACECQTNESLDGIIREKLNKNLEEMNKRAVENWKIKYPWLAKKKDKHSIILDSKFSDFTWTEDAVFCAFVKRQATNIKKFVRISERYYDKNFVNFLPFKIGIVHLMRENWHCDKIGERFGEFERSECQKYRKYLHIFYEFLFRLYVEAKNAELAYHLPAVKPIFTSTDGNPFSLTIVVQIMNEIWNFFFNKNESPFLNEIKLQNEEELNYQIKEDKSGINSSKTKTEIKNIANFRNEFKRKMESLSENVKENVKEATKKLEKAKSETENDEEKRKLDFVYFYGIGTFDSSLFS